MKKAPDYDELLTSLGECNKILTGATDMGSVFSTAALMSAVDDKGRYLHWQDICDRTHNKEKALAHWSLIKMARRGALFPVGDLFRVVHAMPLFYLLPSIQRTCSLIDRRCTEIGLNDLLGGRSMDDQIFKDFIDEESIASSQLEGAATTRAAAKQMIKEGRSPRNEDEKMILGNQRLMTKAWENRFEDMSIEMLKDFHLAGCLGIDDEKYTPGFFRTDNSVYVVGRDDEIVHTPPDVETLHDRLDQLVDWINFKHENASSPKKYLHPVTKACIIHFMIGYLHPFNDGNGRVARALCYWALFRHGYNAFRYISISQLLKEAPIQYGEAYLKTETDNMDLTYFVEYQCRILERAINNTIEKASAAIQRLRDFDLWLFNAGIQRKLTTIQLHIIHSIAMEPQKALTVKELSENAAISDGAARQNLEKMVAAGILTRSGGGGSKPVIYAGKKTIEKIKEGIIRLVQ